MTLSGPIVRAVTRASMACIDFRGLSPKSFDGHGNYTFGINDQLIFPEVDYDKIDAPRGFDITIVTTAANDEQGRAFLRAYGFPFKQENK